MAAGKRSKHVGLYQRGDSPFWWATIHITDPATGQRKRKALSTESADCDIAVLIRDRLQAEANAAAASGAGQSGSNSANVAHHFTRERAEDMVNLFLRWHGVDPLAGKRHSTPPWRVFTERWTRDLDLLDISPATRAQYVSHSKRFTDWLLKKKADRDLPLGGITRERIQDFYRYLIEHEGLRPKTVQNVIKTLRMIFATAIEDDLITRNPAAKLRIPTRISTRQKDPFSLEDLKKLFALIRSGQVEMGGEWETVILFGLCTGARLGDCVTREWSDVHDAGDAPGSRPPFLTFVPQKTKRHGNRELSVPLEDPLRSHLQSLHRSAKKPKTGPICPTLIQCPINFRDGLSSQFRKIIDRAGIDYRSEKPRKGTRGITWRSKGFHSFRATLPSLMAKAEVPPEVRMKILGHTQIETHQLYTHFEDTQLRTAIHAAMAGIREGW